MFWADYNPDTCRISKTFILRLELKQYKSITMRRLVLAIQWFNSTFNQEEYYFYFRFTHTFSHSGNENPKISIHRKIDDYDIGTYQIKNWKVIRLYDGEN